MLNILVDKERRKQCVLIPTENTIISSVKDDVYDLGLFNVFMLE